MTQSCFRVILVGAGDRGMIYAKESLCPNADFQIVAVVEPMQSRRDAAGELFNIAPSRRYASVAQATREGKFADAAFICTMDKQHADTAIPFMELGYHILLEKPIAPGPEDTQRIIACAREHHSIVMVCHVLRYAPFYTEIKKRIAAGELGCILNIQMAEQVSYYHMSVSYVRGKYGDPGISGSGMLLSKCSHDLDLMVWFMNGEKPTQVYSVGSLQQFKPENAPAGAAERCLPGCAYRDTCPYSAKMLYVDHPQRWANRVWNDCGLRNADEPAKLRSLAEADNQYGRCVYRTNMKIVDHQSVLVAFESGATATLNMVGGASAAGRTLRIIGTRGELEGSFEQERFAVHHIAPEAAGGRVTEIVDVSAQQKRDAHGGGDARLLSDFWALLRGEEASICCTSLERSIIGHEIAYQAEACRNAGSKI